jgi:hypothetical protein
VKPRAPLRKVSAKRLADGKRRLQVCVEVFERDAWTCQMVGWRGECFGILTVHHVKKASQGGKYEADNLLTACVRNNDLIETYPKEAREKGWVK